MKKFSLISLYILFQILGFFKLFEILVKSSKNENLNKKETQLNYKEWDKEEEEEKNKYFKLLLQNYDQKIQNRPQKPIFVWGILGYFGVFRVFWCVVVF